MGKHKKPFLCALWLGFAATGFGFLLAALFGVWRFVPLCAISGGVSGALFLPMFIQDVRPERYRYGKAAIGGTVATAFSIPFAALIMALTFGGDGMLSFAVFALVMVGPFAIPVGIVTAIFLQKHWWRHVEEEDVQDVFS